MCWKPGANLRNAAQTLQHLQTLHSSAIAAVPRMSPPLDACVRLSVCTAVPEPWLWGVSKCTLSVHCVCRLLITKVG